MKAYNISTQHTLQQQLTMRQSSKDLCTQQMAQKRVRSLSDAELIVTL
jgi:hypothetical protein